MTDKSQTTTEAQYYGNVPCRSCPDGYGHTRSSGGCLNCRRPPHTPEVSTTTAHREEWTRPLTLQEQLRLCLAMIESDARDGDFDVAHTALTSAGNLLQKMQEATNVKT